VPASPAQGLIQVGSPLLVSAAGAPAAAMAPTTAGGVTEGLPAPAIQMAPLTDWRPVDPENTLVIDTTKGRIVVELRPELAPHAVERIKRLARSGVYDGLQFDRVIASFIAQSGNPNNFDGGKSIEPDIAPEFTFRLGPDTPHVQVARPLGESEGFIGSSPYVAVDEVRMATSPDHRVTAWGAHCSGVMAMGHDPGGAWGNSEFYFMRETTRSLDRDYTVVGRAIAGLDVIRALNVGDPPRPADRMLQARIMADMPVTARPSIMVLNTLSPQFLALVAQVRALKGADFSVCDVDVPVRVAGPATPVAPVKRTVKRKGRRFRLPLIN
jgi:peptidylprolyl isomerase